MAGSHDGWLQILDAAVVLGSGCKMRINCFHDVADLPPRLLNGTQTGVVHPFAFNEGTEVIIERHENPVVVDAFRVTFATIATGRPARRMPIWCDRGQLH